MAEVAPPYTAEQLDSDDVTKKDIVKFLQETASFQFLADHKLKGTLNNIAKTKKKDELKAAYNTLFETKAFRKEGEEDSVKKVDVAAVTESTKKLTVKAEEEPPKYEKRVLKKGDKRNYPKKGDTVSCFYTGKLPNGDIFDSNVVGVKRAKKQPLRFKLGVGNVIKGWDEGLKSMSVGEKSEFIIQSEWCYGKKGLEGKNVTIPPNTDLTFEIELVNID